MSDEEENDHNNNIFKNNFDHGIDDRGNTCNKILLPNLTNPLESRKNYYSINKNNETSSNVNNFVNSNANNIVETTDIHCMNTLHKNQNQSSESRELSENDGLEDYDDTSDTDGGLKYVSQKNLDCENLFSEWGHDTDRAEVVLSEVACWLNGRGLSTFGAVCSTWRAIVRQPRPWRQALISEHGLTLHSMQALADYAAETDTPWSWRSECLLSSAGWELRSSQRAAGGAELLHAAASDCGRLVAIGADDASVTILTQPDWTLKDCISLRDLGWATVARMQWAGGSTSKLLVAGPLVLAARWELVVLNVSEEKVTISSRAACGAGGASSWLRGGDTFLTLELRRAGPWLATTSVWLYSAKQETQSEHAGVAAPVLRLFNEGRAHFTHAAVVDVPEDAWRHHADNDMDRAYYQATLKTRHNARTYTILVLAGGSATSRNRATSLSVWELSLNKPPPVLACNGGDLRSRRLARAARPHPVDDEDESGPEEETLRALCTPPAACCDFGARVLGLAAHPGARCVWTSLDDGRMVCSGVPTLVTLRVLGGGGLSGATHYIQPAISPLLLASPAVCARAVRVWCSRSGAKCLAPVLTLPSSSETSGPPVVQTLLLPMQTSGAPVMLVLVGDLIQVWRSRAPWFDLTSEQN